MTQTHPPSGFLLAAVAFLLVTAFHAAAAPPDLTAGEAPGDSVTINLGATGMRGWVYHDKTDTSESRQILITEVDAGSPADGILAVDDVILGADGSGAAPLDFTSDARRGLAYAIADAEARDPAELQLLRWRAGVTTPVTITLEHLGAYSATAPYGCWKSTRILEKGIEFYYHNESAGRYSFGDLALLAANDVATTSNPSGQFLDRAETEARSLVPSPSEIADMMSDVRDSSSAWQRGHTLIFLAEYFLVTGDTEVLPAIEAYAVNIAKNTSLFGTAGHIYAEKNLDGSNNGPMGGGYGAVNSSGMPCFLGLLLAKKCGLTNPEIDPAIERTSRFFAYYSGKGAPPYGEHEASSGGHENNGKSGLGALAFTLQSNRAEEQKFFSQMATGAATEREFGHTGPFFNYLWAPLGAACGGEEAAATHFSRISWMLDLCRRWDGSFVFDALHEGSSSSGGQYRDFRMSTPALLVYALPRRQLHLTGREHDPARFLNSSDVAWAVTADDYDAASRTINELVTDLGMWSPKVQREAANELGTRTVSASTITQLTNLANDTNGSSRVGACLALGKINDSGSANARASTLAALLTDSENHVRFMAAEAMRYLPHSAKISQLDTVLAAAASTAQDFTPYNEEDPLHFAHGRIAVLLFYSGNAYGPRGMIYDDLTGVDRELLYPAIEAVAANPIGFCRSTLSKTYKDNLTQADVEAMAGAIVDSVMFRTPADKMFSAGVRQGGIEALQKYGIAEGVPLSMIYMVNDTRGGNYDSALGVLENYAGSCTTVDPDPDVIGFCEALLGGNQAAAAQAVLDAIEADSSPTTLTPFKSITSIGAATSSITLPDTSVTLQVTATDLAEGTSVYTWRKVHGVGDVTFVPNGTTFSDTTTVSFDGMPGQYRFEVAVSDSRGLTEVYDTVAVTLYDTGGTLPPNDPPTANPQAITAAPAAATPITLTASDPEGYPLIYTLTSPPSHGSLTGIIPDLTYTADWDYTGSDSFTFEVMDTEGQVSSAIISITVDPGAIELFVYEPFNYPTNVKLETQGGGLGMTGSWLDIGGGYNGFAYIFDDSPGSTPVNNDGGPLTWDGVVNGFPTGPSEGIRYISNGVGDGDKAASYRYLEQSAGAMAGGDGVLWMSAVWHSPGTGYGEHVGLALSTDAFKDRSRQLDTSGTYGAGLGNGIGVGGAINSRAVTPVIFDGGAIDVRTTAGATEISTALDNIIVLKFEFGATDTVSAYTFTEDAALSETTFNSFAVSATSTISETSLHILTFSQVRGGNALDEIRIGKTFTDIISPPPPGPVDAALSSVVASPDTVVANGVATSTITVSLWDPIGTPVPGKSVTLANSGGTQAATISPTGALVTDANGQATFAVTSTTAGTEEFTATNTTDSQVITQSATVTFVDTPDPGLSTVTASPTSVTADGTSSSTVTVTLLAQGSVPLPDKEVSIAASPAAATITPEGSLFTDVNGQVTWAVSSTTPGQVVFTATAVGSGIVVSETATVDFLDPSIPQAFNISFERFTGGGTATPDPGTLVGPAGGPGDTWNQIASPDSAGPILTAGGATTSVTIDSTFTEGRAGNGSDQPAFHASLTDFGRGIQNRTVTISGLPANSLYDVWLLAYRDNGSAAERLGAHWSTGHPTTSSSPQTLSSFVTRNGTTFEDGVNYLLFEGVEANGSGMITFSADAFATANGDPADLRSGLSGLQLVPAAVPTSAFDTWAASSGLTGNPGLENGLGDDPDTGGQNNLYEFALGGNPLNGNDDGSLLHAFSGDVTGGPELEGILTILVRNGASFSASGNNQSATADGVTYTVSADSTVPVGGNLVVTGTTPVTTGLPGAPAGYKFVSFYISGSQGYFQVTVEEG